MKVTDKQYYMDGYLQGNLMPLKETIKKDWDVVICIDGAEGSGKSVLAQQIAYFFDETFNHTRMTIGLEDFEQAIHESKPGQAIVGDEMMRLLNSRSAMTQVNKRIVELLAEVRQKNLFILLVMPSFFDMDKYGALWRTTALIHVYTADNRKRGFFSFFGAAKKKMLYLLGKKFYNYRATKPNFIGRFANTYVIDEVEYRKKKNESLKTSKDKYEKQDKNLMRLLLLIAYNHDVLRIPYTKQAEAMKISTKTIERMLKPSEDIARQATGDNYTNRLPGGEAPVPLPPV